MGRRIRHGTPRALACRCLCPVKAQADYTLPSVVPDVARIGIDHGEEGADALPVLLHRPIRCPARPESVALVRPAQPVGRRCRRLQPRRMANRSPSTSRANNTGPGLPSVPRYTAGTAGGPSPSPLGLLSITASIHGRRLWVHRTRARLTHSSDRTGSSATGPARDRGQADLHRGGAAGHGCVPRAAPGCRRLSTHEAGRGVASRKCRGRYSDAIRGIEAMNRPASVARRHNSAKTLACAKAE